MASDLTHAGIISDEIGDSLECSGGCGGIPTAKTPRLICTTWRSAVARSAAVPYIPRHNRIDYLQENTDGPSVVFVEMVMTWSLSRAISWAGVSGEGVVGAGHPP
ncbi:hypothetical protein RW1_049_00640 [Rhodococcus wratislaviensis NBRC 100605]|uniref:Uncharacterized protein n=1 Tax=Rhodococcus wratislaviensis NBRC 100605 TaxID=1219028 RepID=X0RAX2_RHOWR|nr:hypothetical protein RW1_049_00640 [Rhodococcus wratislaviensis NBRC 100605]